MATQDTEDNITACIEACEEALHACQECAAHDIRESGHGDMGACALLNLDCADICAATLNALARRSPHHGDFCALCAHVCRTCAAECAKHAGEHAHCARCQQACEACASACEQHASERHPL
ncbi:protein of unknown function DUF326 [Acidovorax delafieldii 2AN]|uniref:Ferredoxin n=2 Tax=Acidovorax delafieldii TaxID=47920 RepID=C5T5J6_ACIDE|nr:protein of unknown function DUF326 [Acidovorax delafieldii 2AN]